MPEGLGRTSLGSRAVGSGSFLTLLLLDKKRAWGCWWLPSRKGLLLLFRRSLWSLISMWHDCHPNEDHRACVILAAAPAHAIARFTVLQDIKCFLHHGSSVTTGLQKTPGAFKAGCYCPRALSFLADGSELLCSTDTKAYCSKNYGFHLSQPAPVWSCSLLKGIF